jgi:hypothetical protein
MESGKVDTRTTGSDKAPSRRVKPADDRFGTGPMPLEWMDGSSWRLPSGKALAEFALQSGFLAPLMLQLPRLSKPTKKGKQ